MEQNGKQFMGFKEEDYILRKWVSENIKLKFANAFDPMWGEYAPYRMTEIEKDILSILDDIEFYVLYIESNIDNGIWNVFLLGHDGSDWIQSCWENEQKIALRKPILSDNWNKKICNFRFSDDILVNVGKYIIFDETSAYLFINCHDRLKRFAVYHPDFSRIDEKSDDRYILKIQKVLKNIRKNYLWIKLFQRKKST